MKFVHMACAGLFLLAGAALAQDGGKTVSMNDSSKTAISLGTATPGGGFPLYGSAFAEAMNAADPETLIKTWLPASLQGFEQFQKMFWTAVGDSGKSKPK